MSFNRENVTWQSPDGSWNLGFFEAWVWGDDPEWDVDYSLDNFEWVTTGHRSEDAALEAWDGANPGGTIIVRKDDDVEYVRKLDKMARAAIECGRGARPQLRAVRLR